MARGDGSITPQKDKDGRPIRNRWRVCVPLGVDRVTGKRRRHTVIVRGTKTDARRERDRLLEEHRMGLKVERGRMTFSELAEEWKRAQEEREDVSANVCRQQKAKADLLAGYMGEARISDVTASNVEDVLRDIREDKAAAGAPICSTTLLEYFQILKRIFARAVAYDYILRNPCDKVRAPRRREPERRSLTLADAARLRDALDGSEAEERAEYAGKEARRAARGGGNRKSSIGLGRMSCHMAVRLALASGMRRGELLGLTWGDVSENCDALRVRRALDKDGKPKPPKTRAGIRSIALDAETAARLIEWREFQRGELATLGKIQGKHTPVCCDNTGGDMQPRTLSRWWDAWRAANGFPGLRLHELRHTQATQLLAAGVDVKTVQTRMGHANASITLDWYAHAIPANDEAAASIFGAAVEGARGAVVPMRSA